jgi:hypothetical protein
MAPMGFESTVSAGERSQTYALDRTGTGIGKVNIKHHKITEMLSQQDNNNNNNNNNIV